jgi:hypothetical protein
MRELRVDTFICRSAAAPPRPETLQAAALAAAPSARTMFARSKAASSSESGAMLRPNLRANLSTNA